MTFYEFTGKSVKEAVAKACEELSVEEALLEVDVLVESAKGFLGIVGHRDARIRVKKRDILKEVFDTGKPEKAEPAPPSNGPRAPVEATEESEPDTDFGDEPTAEKVEAALFLEDAARILREILQRIPEEAEVEASISEGAVYLDIKGDGSGLLIGKKGQTLDALQYLVSKIVNKANPAGSKVEVVVDSENYRIRKRENLRETAIKTSEKAKKTLKPVSLNPMPAAERRIIHLILAEDRDVYTKSYGEGPMRRIIVYPRKGMANKRRRR